MPVCPQRGHLKTLSTTQHGTKAKLLKAELLRAAVILPARNAESPKPGGRKVAGKNLGDLPPTAPKAAHRPFFNRTTRSHPTPSRRLIRCIPRQSFGRGWWPRRSPPALSWLPVPIALGLCAAEFLGRGKRKVFLQLSLRKQMPGTS